MPDGSRLTSYLGDTAAEQEQRRGQGRGGRNRARGRRHATVRVLAGTGAQESREEVQALPASVCVLRIQQADNSTRLRVHMADFCATTLCMCQKPNAGWQHTAVTSDSNC